jgi:sugar lactone lactonase YvrE
MLAPWSKLHDSRFQLGEGSHYDPKTSCIYWVDILGNSVQSLHIPTNSYHQYPDVPEASAVILAEVDFILVTGRHSIWKLLLKSGEVIEIFKFKSESIDNRCNEAKIDPFGNIWIGTMNREESKISGSLWKIDQELNETKYATNFGIPNTLLWDVQRDRFYYGDSNSGAIYVDAIGEPLSKTIYFQGNLKLGSPDGSCIDSEGNIYNARWGASLIAILDTSGKLSRTIDLPIKYPTSCTFLDSRSIAITSAVMDSSNEIDGCLLQITI